MCLIIGMLLWWEVKHRPQVARGLVQQQVVGRSLPTIPEPLPAPTIWMAEVSARDCGPRGMRPWATTGLDTSLTPPGSPYLSMAGVWRGETRLWG